MDQLSLTVSVHKGKCEADHNRLLTDASQWKVVNVCLSRESHSLPKVCVCVGVLNNNISGLNLKAH